MTKKRLLLASILASTCCFATARADEFGDNTPYYEDDAWYDVSEWFDGNDYNPTDEAIGRWDNETFSFAENLTSSDYDNDDNSEYGRTWGDYGYYQNADKTDSWYYDYYDDGYGNWSNDFVVDNSELSSYTVYIDNDDDGLYDSYRYYYDTDGDGVFDGFDYFTFDATSADNENAKAEGQKVQKSTSAKSQQIAGTIKSTKTVDVRGKKHLVAQIAMDGGKTMAVDLGTNPDKSKLSEGNSLQASGHRIMVGDKTILIADQAQTNNKDLAIDRGGRQYNGTVVSLRNVKVAGQQHLLAKVSTENKKSLLVDLGASDKLSTRPNVGDSVTVEGVPVKVKDRVVLMARSMQPKNGQEVSIQRGRMKSSS
jgi:hypothetical protein